MKRNFILSLLAMMAVALCAPVAWGQMTSVKGYVHDVQGQPVPGATVEFINKENGRKYDLKTNAKGEYYTLGITSGRYDLFVIKDGKQLWKETGVPLSFSDTDNVVNVDLKKELANQQAQISPEEKARQEAAAKEATKLKGLNDMLAQARTAMEGGNPQQAVTVLAQASQLDPNQPVIWAALGEAERNVAQKQADASEKKAGYAKSVEDYKKAIALKPTASYYNNMADAAARAGDSQAAIEAYHQAATLDPTNAAQYYYNEGAVLTNTGKVDEAIQAFDKAIQADPNKADAYYWKGVNMLGKATLKGNKMEAPPGTAEAFNKYLELQPNGQFAQPAKDMLASIGAQVETSFGKTKKTKK